MNKIAKEETKMNKVMKVGWKRLFIPMLAVVMLVGLTTSPGYTLTIITGSDGYPWLANMEAGGQSIFTYMPTVSLVAGTDITTNPNSPVFAPFGQTNSFLITDPLNGGLQWSLVDFKNIFTPQTTTVTIATSTAPPPNSPPVLTQTIRPSTPLNGIQAVVDNPVGTTYGLAYTEIRGTFKSSGTGDITMTINEAITQLGLNGLAAGSAFTYAVLSKNPDIFSYNVGEHQGSNPDYLTGYFEDGATATGTTTIGWAMYNYYGNQEHGQTYDPPAYLSNHKNQDLVTLSVGGGFAGDDIYVRIVTSAIVQTLGGVGDTGKAFADINGISLNGVYYTTPEPGTLLLFGFGLVSLALIRRRLS